MENSESVSRQLEQFSGSAGELAVCLASSQLPQSIQHLKNLAAFDSALDRAVLPSEIRHGCSHIDSLNDPQQEAPDDEASAASQDQSRADRSIALERDAARTSNISIPHDHFLLPPALICVLCCGLVCAQSSHFSPSLTFFATSTDSTWCLSCIMWTQCLPLMRHNETALYFVVSSQLSLCIVTSWG